MALLSLLLPDLRGGGAERLHVNLANQWAKQGHAVEFALMSKHGDLIEILPPSLTVIDLNAPRLRTLLFTLVRYLRRTKPDVTLAAMWPLTSVAIFAWMLAGRPGRIFVSDHSQLSISAVEEMHVPKWLLGGMVRLTYPRASGAIMVSEGVKRDLCALANLPLEAMKVIYNPTAIGLAQKEIRPGMRAQIWGEDVARCILSVGTLKTQKDHETLIEAFSLVPKQLKAKLVILGEGSLRPKLEALVHRLGLEGQVLMPGFTLDPYPWYQTADLFVLSSRWEGFGNVIVEALECGLPVVSTDCPSGPAEILEDGRYGKLVPTQNPKMMAAAIEESLSSIHDREALRRRAKEFSVEKIADEYLSFMLPKGMR